MKTRAKPKRTVRLTPFPTDLFPAGMALPAAGRMRVELAYPRSVTAREYVVVEFPTGFSGRGFRLTKIGEFGDRECSGYDVFCSARGAAADHCDCKGNSRFGHCLHAEAVRALVENGKL